MIRLFVGSIGVQASPILRQRISSAPQIARNVSSAASNLTNAHAGLIVRDGKAVLYRGPSAMKTTFYVLIGGMFVGIGGQLSYSFYNNLTWPLTWRNPDNPPHLVGLGYRIAFSGVALTLGLFVGWLFFAVPTKTITKLTLDVSARQLIMRTSSREFSALLPRMLFPRPFRTTAEIKGYYKTDRINERIVPLSQVYRIRGSALAAGPKSTLNRVINEENRAIIADDRQCLEIKVGEERAWYRLETSGGADPPKKGGYQGFWRRIQHRLRGKTNWEGQKNQAGLSSDQLGEKEPWFANRRTFDDVIPLIKRM